MAIAIVTMIVILTAAVAMAFRATKIVWVIVTATVLAAVTVTAAVGTITALAIVIGTAVVIRTTE